MDEISDSLLPSLECSFWSQENPPSGIYCFRVKNKYYSVQMDFFLLLFFAIAMRIGKKYHKTDFLIFSQ